MLKFFPTLPIAAALLCLHAPVHGQNNGIDPPVDGNIHEIVDHQVTLTDGYRTYMDLRYPTVQPNSEGWPLVIFVHTSGTSRDQVTAKATSTARRGYFTVTYDVRGQGLGMGLNDPQVYGRAALGTRERLDMFEVIEAAEALYPQMIDMDRVGVTGRSQGAYHSWCAAAHSGRVPPPNPWRSQPFPEIHAVAPINFIPDLLEGMMPGGETGTEMLLRMMYDPMNGLNHEPAFFALVDSYIRAEDFPGLANQIYDPNLDLVSLLQTSTVPVFASLVYDDKYAPANRLVETWNTLVPNAQKYLNLATTGHSSVFNDFENEIREFRRDRWFDFHLKQVANQAEHWQEFRFAVTPESVQDFQDTTYLWDAREFDAFPFANGSTQTWFLTRDGDLAGNGGPNGKLSLSQSLEGNIGSVDDYINFLPSATAVEKDVQLDSVDFETSAFANDQLMIGEGEVELAIDTEDSDFMIHAALFSEPEGKYITGGQMTVRDYNGGESTFTFPLNFQSFMIKKGTRLPLRLENLAWHRPEVTNQPTFLHAIPIFNDFELDVRVGNSASSKLTLPMAPLTGPSLTSKTVLLNRKGSGDISFTIRSDESRSGWSYQLMAGSSGVTPGHFIDGVHIPLNRDWLTDMIEQNPGGLPISGFTGTLDNQGAAQADVFLSSLNKIPRNIDELDFVVVLTPPQGDPEVSQKIILPVLD